jgi:ABC-type tungstate transport system permease subunit
MPIFFPIAVPGCLQIAANSQSSSKAIGGCSKYGVILVNPAKHPHVRAKEGQTFIDWLISPQGQSTIADYKIGGEQLFFPNALHPPAS